VLTLRSVEKVRLTIVATLIALTLNLGLNYLLIFGIGPFPALGVRGAAIATVIARYVETAILVTGCYLNRYPPAGTLKELFAFNSDYAARFLKVAFPVILNEVFWSVGVTAQNLIFARTSTEAIAAFNITNTVSQLTWVAFIGLGNGIAVLIGKKIGEGRETEAREYAYRISRFAPMLSLGAGLVLVPLSRLLPFIFNAGPDVLATAAIMFIMLACTYPARAFNMSMIIGICRAGGDTAFCVIYDTAIMWILTLPLAAIAAYFFHAPPLFLYFCVIVEDPIKTVFGFWRLKTGKWLHNVIN
jgi:putative MATE family efflux protein